MSCGLKKDQLFIKMMHRFIPLDLLIYGDIFIDKRNKIYKLNIKTF